MGLKSASTSAKWQFVGTVDQGENGGFMLNTDFALFYDLKGFMKSTVLKLGFLRKSKSSEMQIDRPDKSENIFGIKY